MQDYENDNAPEWAINISFDIVKNITNGNYGFLYKDGTSSRLTQEDIITALKEYPAFFAAPKPDKKSDFTGINITGTNCWCMWCPFYDENGDMTDLTLDLEVCYHNNKYTINIMDILVH